MIIVRGSYRSAEKIFIWLTIPFFAYPIAAILAHPHWSDVGHAFVTPTIHIEPAFLILLIATAGTTITPYMQLYLQSAVVERGVREDELGHEQREAVLGAVFANVIAASIIIATGATLFTHGIHEISSAADAATRAQARSPEPTPRCCSGSACSARACSPPRSCRSLPHMSISESLGYEKGVGRRREEAPVFVAIITAMIAVSALVAVIPGVPVISLLVGVQVVNGLLLPINLFFIWRLSRSERVMGKFRSGKVLGAATGITVVVTSTLSAILVVITLGGVCGQAPPADSTNSGRPDRPTEVAERGHEHVRGTEVGEQVRLHRLGDALRVWIAEPHAEPAADDHGRDVEQVDRRGDAGAERARPRARSARPPSLSSCSSARSQIPLVRRVRSCSFISLNRSVCLPFSCSLRACISIAARPA